MFNTVLLHCYNSSLTYLNDDADQLIVEVQIFVAFNASILFFESYDISSLTFIKNYWNSCKSIRLIWYSQCYMLLLHKRRFLLPIEVFIPSHIYTNVKYSTLCLTENMKFLCWGMYLTYLHYDKIFEHTQVCTLCWL